ncbi:MAG: hypothetical protein V5A56_16045 [Halolamina sp.]
MEFPKALALFAIVALIMSTGGLVVSLQVSNPLFTTAAYRFPSIVTLVVTAVAVGLATTLGLWTTRSGTPYW